MSDLFKPHQFENSDIKNNFNPTEHLNALCKKGRIKTSQYAEIIYKSGWVDIIQELIMSIINHPIEISTINDQYGILNVNFSSYEKNQEIKVWRAISSAQNRSKDTCSSCGNFGKPRIFGEKLVIICRDCINVAEKNGETGTWLDKY